MKRNYTILTVSRARRVHQSLITTLPTAIISFLTCVDHITMEPLLSRGNSRAFADVLIMNGPGTCLVLCAAVYVNRVMSWASSHSHLRRSVTGKASDTFATVFRTTITQTYLYRILCTRSISKSIGKAPSSLCG